MSIRVIYSRLFKPWLCLFRRENGLFSPQNNREIVRKLFDVNFFFGTAYVSTFRKSVSVSAVNKQIRFVVFHAFSPRLLSYSIWTGLYAHISNIVVLCTYYLYHGTTTFYRCKQGCVARSFSAVNFCWRFRYNIQKK